MSETENVEHGAPERVYTREDVERLMVAIVVTPPRANESISEYASAMISRFDAERQ